jgi:hypothetical protein
LGWRFGLVAMSVFLTFFVFAARLLGKTCPQVVSETPV